VYGDLIRVWSVEYFIFCGRRKTGEPEGKKKTLGAKRRTTNKLNHL